MLKRTQRIPRSVFQKVFRGALRGRTFGVSLSVSRVRTPYPRIAIVVRKGTAKSAVLRNTLRRRGYAAAEEIIKEGVLPAEYFVFTFEKGVETLSHQKLVEKMKEVVHKTLASRSSSSAHTTHP